MDAEPLCPDAVCSACCRVSAARCTRCGWCRRLVCLPCAVGWGVRGFFWEWLIRSRCAKCRARKQD